MRVLVLGGKGMLGTDLVAELGARGHEAVSVDLDILDVTDPSAVARIASDEFGKLDVCVNCAAYTAVDKAESEERLATELNAIAPGYIAKVCLLAGVRLIHISTDFVFDGSASTPYSEEAGTNPLGVYGHTKRDGEMAVLSSHQHALVVRTAWLYGANGKSFPRTMIEAWKAGKNLRVVADQIGCPTYTGDLARVLVDLAEKNPFPGIYHAVGPETMSWHAFAVQAIEVYREAKGLEQPVEIAAIKAEEYPTPAKRPAYSVLGMAKLAEAGVAPMRPVRESLSEFCAKL